MHHLWDSVSTVPHGSCVWEHSHSLCDYLSIPYRCGNDDLLSPRFRLFIRISSFRTPERCSINTTPRMTRKWKVWQSPTSWSSRRKQKTRWGLFIGILDLWNSQNRLDLGKETISCYLEVRSSDQEASELQLLSIRYHSDFALMKMVSDSIDWSDRSRFLHSHSFHPHTKHRERHSPPLFELERCSLHSSCIR